uniref:Uncharacterized protein n=1 Tax=Romanomermis culicivorax TaxID=13658 RepID=A0A915HP90_ROMCU
MYKSRSSMNEQDLEASLIDVTTSVEVGIKYACISKEIAEGNIYTKLANFTHYLPLQVHSKGSNFKLHFIHVTAETHQPSAILRCIGQCHR